MKSYAWLAALVLALGCTKPNPKDCADGLCTDPAYPFCDIDGALAGEAKTCIAVSCTPSELETCRGDMSIVCNAVGNDYDLVQCEKGCDPTHGCRACVAAGDCANPTPVCDMSESNCRACRVDDECPSLVCEQGSCINEAAILYAKSNGSDSSDCSLMQPCTMYRAQNLALGAAVPPIIRLLPGVYPLGLEVATPTSAPLKFVATGATIAAQTAVSVRDGANVDIRGIRATGVSFAVSCDSAVTARSSLELRESTLTPGDAGATLVILGKCTLSLSDSELDIGASTGPSIGIYNTDGATLVADRVHFHGANVSMIGVALSTRIGVRITNSLLENVSFQWSTSDSGPPGSMISMGFNTMVLEQNTLNCATNSGSPYRTSRYENNIVISSQPSAVNGTDCTLSNNVLVPFTGTLGTNIPLDPQFENAAAKDYRLKATSPAVDAAVPTAILPATIDYAGVSRPQGAGADIGAFEYRP